MSMVRKLHPHIAKDFKGILSENNISTKKLVINLETETIEDFDDYSVDDILSVAGISEARGSSRIIRSHSRVSGGLGKVIRNHSYSPPDM